MAGTMKAFVMKRIGEVGIMEKPTPEPGPNDAVVRTTAALVCTSDTHTVAGAIGERTNLTPGARGGRRDPRARTIRTALCPGGSERMRRLMRLIETGRVDPTPLTTHRFPFREVEKAFRMMQTKEDGIIKPLILFE